MQIHKTNEKLLIWMFRKGITQIDLFPKLHLKNRQALAKKIENNDFDQTDLLRLKKLGFEM